ncbi:hypothetical protein [Saccharopolyspora rosea]|uniref:Uncharacterized protein n=1 Tax=Saccharopolyspora rosea TaxID=524884 RepID=A0ABW3FK87_9PSEU|nr:hypothetical protein [Saccharopolyspora rosea]
MFGLDIRDFFTGRQPWPRLLRLVEQLPRTSRVQAALAADEQRAEALLDLAVDDEEQEARPPLETWSQEAELLAHIADLLAHLRADYAQVNSKNHRRRNPQPVPRPETGVERVRRRRERRQHRDLATALLPDKPVKEASSHHGP